MTKFTSHSFLIHMYGIYNNLSYRSKETSIYLNNSNGSRSTSIIVGALICRRTESSSVAFGVIAVLSPLLWSHCFSRYLWDILLCASEGVSVALQYTIAANHCATVRENLNFLNGEHPRLSGTLHDTEWSPMTAVWWWLFGAAPPRVNTSLCLHTCCLAKGKQIPEAGALCLALTFLAMAAGSQSVFDLILLPAK